MAPQQLEEHNTNVCEVVLNTKKKKKKKKKVSKGKTELQDVQVYFGWAFVTQPKTKRDAV